MGKPDPGLKGNPPPLEDVLKTMRDRVPKYQR